MADECPSCGARGSQVLSVWKDEADRGESQPEYIACESCRRLIDPYLASHGNDEQPPQAALTAHETKRLRIGNQHSHYPSIIEWQCIKGAAVYYGVTDWTSKVDSTLTMEENIGLMATNGSTNQERTIRMMPTPDE